MWVRGAHNYCLASAVIDIVYSRNGYAVYNILGEVDYNTAPLSKPPARIRTYNNLHSH